MGENVANFYAAIERIDQNLGELRTFMKETGLDQNTILIFLTDNGTTMPNDHNSAGMRGRKGTVYEGGHRVPCFIYWPQKDIPHAVGYEELTSVTDLLPTLIDICQLDIDGNVLFDGQTLKPLLFGEASGLGNRRLLVEQQRVPNPVKWKTSVVLDKKWRLVNGKELYDMEEDFGQKQDVSEKYPEIVSDLRVSYEKIWESVSANDHEYHRLILGSSEEPETLLSAQDWYWKNNSDQQNLVVGQATVREGKISNGIWPVEIANDGEYIFELRRWPKESGLSLNESTPAVNSESNDIELKKWGKKPQGKVFDIIKAKLRVNEIEKELSVDMAMNPNVEISIELTKGLADIQTWFYTSEGDSLGAYYVYARLMSK